MTQQGGVNHWSPQILASQSNYLLLLAQFQMPRRLRSRFEPADMAQTTLEKALAKLDQCRAETEAQFRAWLRKILTNVLAEEVRRIPPCRAGQNDSDAVQDSSRDFEEAQAKGSTPSERLRREEQMVRLANAIAALPADQQRAIRLHHLDGLSLIDVGQRMSRSKEAVAGLLFRGLKSLRDALI